MLFERVGANELKHIKHMLHINTPVKLWYLFSHLNYSPH